MKGIVDDMNTAKSLKWWQWETLLVTMGGYALYYVIRKNLSIAMPLLGEIGVSKVQLGAFLTCGGIVYGVGRFLNGIVADRNSARKVMALGLLICGLVNILFGLSDYIVTGGAAPVVEGGAAAASALVWTMGVIWIVNQYFQGMGVGPCIKTLPKWFPPEELSTKQSIWNLSHSIGAGSVFALCGWLLIPAFHSWRLCFIVPAAIALCGAVAVMFLFKDSPEVVGLSIGDVGAPRGSSSPSNPSEGVAGYKSYVSRWVFRNPKVWVIAIADFFVYTVRFAALDWGIVLLMETKGLSLAQATTQQATPRAAGVAGGFVGIFSYASTILSGIGFGYVAQHWGWNAAYATILAASVTGGVVLVLIWRAPAVAQQDPIRQH